MAYRQLLSYRVTQGSFTSEVDVGFVVHDWGQCS